MFLTLTITNNDACTYEISENSSACIALDSEDNDTVVPCHIRDSHVELNVPSVYKYFHTCGMESDLVGAADVCDKLPAWDYCTFETILYKHILHLDTAAYSMVNLKQKRENQIWGKNTNGSV
jgi:hypothetical protein